MDRKKKKKKRIDNNQFFYFAIIHYIIHKHITFIILERKKKIRLEGKGYEKKKNNKLVQHFPSFSFVEIIIWRENFGNIWE